MRLRSLVVCLVLAITTPFTCAADVIFTLVNSSKNIDICELNANDAIDLRKVGTHLNIRADFDCHPKSVQFLYDGRKSTEKAAPYALAGDNRKNYKSFTPTAGKHTLKAVAFNSSGRQIDQRTIRFTVSGGNSNSGDGNSNSKRYVYSKDIISLHYDFSPDPDDGHSAAADFSILKEFEREKKIKIKKNVVLGTVSKYGPEMTSSTFHTESQKLMSNVYGRYINAYANWNGAVATVADRWRQVIKSGGNVWVKEGGPSDFTADVVRRLHDGGMEARITRERIRVIQHGPFGKIAGANELNTYRKNLDFVNNNTSYTKIANGNFINGTAGLNSQEDYESLLNQKTKKKRTRRDLIILFKNAAFSSSSANAWRAAFLFWNPLKDGKNDTMEDRYHKWHRLDFSDTVELLHILNIGQGKVGNLKEFSKEFFGVDLDK